MALTNYASGQTSKWREVTVVIAENAAVSDAIPTKGMRPVMVICPAAWTTAKMRVQTSRDGTAWTAGALQVDGTKIELGAAASAVLTLPETYPIYRDYIRLQSCDANGVDVNQEAARTLTVVLACE